MSHFKNNKLFIIGFIFLLAFSCKTKQTIREEKEINYIPYYLKVYEADSLYLTKNYEESYNILDNLFKKYKPLNFGIYEEYETYIKLSQLLHKKPKSKILISNLVSQYGKRSDDIEQDSILNLVYTNSKLDKNRYDKLREDYLSSLNIPLRDTILKIYDRDYVVRTKKDMLNIRNVDLYNQHLLVELINKFGFPSIQNIGVKSLVKDQFDPVDITEVWLHMMDYNGKEKDFILEQIKKAVKEGKCSPFTLSLIFDRDSRKENKPKSEYYHGFTTSNIELSKDELLKVNARRKQIGLPTFEFERLKIKMYWGN